MAKIFIFNVFLFFNSVFMIFVFPSHWWWKVIALTTYVCLWAQVIIAGIRGRDT